MKRCAAALCWVAITWANTAWAQTRCVVADMETHRPLRGVRVKTDTNATTETDYTGTCIFACHVQIAHVCVLWIYAPKDE